MSDPADRSADPWRHDFVSANGIRFHVVSAGDGPLVLLLHGFPQFWYAWRHQIPALAGRFRVVAPDMRGYGDSDKPPGVESYRIETLVADVVGLIGALGEERARIVAHDWGGAVAWMTAIRHPGLVEKLAVLNCPHPARFAKGLRTWRQLRKSWYMFAFQIPRLPEWALLRNDSAIAESMFREMAVRKDTFSDEDIAELRKALQKPGAATAMLNYYRAAFRYRRSLEDVERSPAVLSMPTRLIWAEDDIALGKELTYGMEPLFSGPFDVHYIPDCSHWVNEEQPDRVNRLLLEFL